MTKNRMTKRSTIAAVGNCSGGFPDEGDFATVAWKSTEHYTNRYEKKDWMKRRMTMPRWQSWAMTCLKWQASFAPSSLQTSRKMLRAQTATVRALGPKDEKLTNRSRWHGPQDEMLTIGSRWQGAWRAKPRWKTKQANKNWHWRANNSMNIHNASTKWTDDRMKSITATANWRNETI